jgi:hypothetical protein
VAGAEPSIVQRLLRLSRPAVSAIADAIANIEQFGDPIHPREAIDDRFHGHISAPHVRGALRAIGVMHFVPKPPRRLPVEFDAPLCAAHGAEGLLYPTLFGGAKKLAIDPDAERFRFTFVHEFGHYLDLVPLGRRAHASLGDPRLDDWRAAVDASEAARTLFHYADNPEDFPAPASENKKREITAWAVKEEEFWARSYSQWIAANAGDEDLERELATEQRFAVPLQWQNSDFQEIEKTLDVLFDELRWSR